MTNSQAATVQRLGVYVLSSDLSRSREFYQDLFSAAPTVETDLFIGFDVAGGLFAVISKQAFAPDAKLGGNAVPYLKVDDIQAALQHVETIAPMR